MGQLVFSSVQKSKMTGQDWVCERLMIAVWSIAT